MRFSRRRGVRRQPRLKFESLEPRWAFHGETLNSVPAYSSPAPTTEPTAIESSSGVQVFNFDGPSNSNVAPSPSEVVPNEVVPNEVVPNEESDTSETTSDNSTFTVTPTTLLPDLTLWDHSLFGFNHLEYLDVHPKTGHKLLRLSTAGVNVGQGPMILAGREVTNGFQRVSQIVRMSDGTTIEYPAGEYVYHATHDHIHFADYAEYNLRSIIDDHGVGPIVATGGKVSFCLMDNAAYDLSLPSAPSTVVFSTCNRFTQGMSVGWADIYSAAVDDQWIDIEGVPDGEYWLETVLDPTNLLRESNEDNNTIRNRVVIGQPTYSPDVYDAAGQFDPHLGTGDQRIHGLSVHAPGEVDRFRWIAPADGEMRVTLTFDRTLGDTDLYVWGSSTNSQIDIQSSTTDGNIEQISYPVRAGETYFVVVRDLAGYTLPDYTLAVDGPDIVPDRLEPNNSILELTHVDTGEQKLTNLNVHAPGDLDYYAWKADRTSSVMLDLRFTHYEGDLNLFIYDFQNQQIGKSTTTTNREFLEFPAIGGEVYLIVVFPEPEARSINYELRITPQTILPDPLEPNDSEHAPYDIGSGNVRLTGLTIEKPFNRDVYKWRAVAQGMAKVDLLFKHADGDLELLLWRDGEEVLLSRTQNDNEHFEFPVLPQQMFLLEVRGRNDAMSPHYDLLVDGTEAPRVLQTNVRRASDLGDESTMLWPGHAADSVPWTDIATIEMVFSKDVLFGDNSLELISEQLEVTRLSLDTYDASRHAAVWKLPTLLAAGNWKIRLPDSVTDAEGNPLDGETIESGNGSGNGIPGGEFILPILVTPGDFTGDRQVDAEDISALFAGLPLTLRRFDLNNDRKSNELDIVYLLKDVMGSTIGDANLDGLFDSADLVQIFQRGQFEDLVVHNSAWADGDWNGDGEFDTGDMVFAFQQGGYII